MYTFIQEKCIQLIKCASEDFMMLQKTTLNKENFNLFIYKIINTDDWNNNNNNADNSALPHRIKLQTTALS